MSSIKSFYFETSAVNFLSKKINYLDASATRAYQSLKSNRYYLSPVVIWEILLTNDEDQRENLIFFIQHFFGDKLIASPSELLMQYIKNNCPILENRFNFHCKLKLAKIWEDIANDSLKTFIYDKKKLDKTITLIREINKLLEEIIKEDDIDISKSINKIFHQISLESIVSSLSFMKSKFNKNLISKEMKKVYKIATFFTLLVLCGECDLESEPIQQFWLKLHIDKMDERIKYILKNYEVLIHRGPFVEMALMAYNQFNLKPSRGLYFDCLHSTYLPYIDYFLTNDEHFRALRNLRNNPNYSKILLMDEVDFNYVK